MRIEIDSVAEIFFTNKPAIACVNAAIKASITPNLISKSGLIIIMVKINPKFSIKLLNFEVFSLKKNIPPKYINNGVLKLIAIACDNGIIVYEQKRRIIVIPPKKPLRNNNFIFFFSLMIFSVLTRNGSKKKTLKRFLKKACSIG